MSEVQVKAVVLPTRNNIVTQGYKLHIALDKKRLLLELLRKVGVVVG